MFGSHTRRQLHEQMTALRAAMAQDADELRQMVADGVDYRRHVRRHPWLSCVGALALGYRAVPLRRTGQATRGTDAEPSETSRQRSSLHHIQETASAVGRAIVQSAALALAEQAATSASRRQPPPDDTADTDTWQELDADLKDEAVPNSNPAASPNGAPASADAESVLKQAAGALEQKLASRPRASLIGAVVAGLCLGWLVKRR